MEQEILRKSLLKAHEVYFVPYSKIASSIGVSGAFISQFTKGERRMSESTAHKLYELLIEKGWFYND